MLVCSEGSGESAHLQRRFFVFSCLFFVIYVSLYGATRYFRLFAKRYFVFSFFSHGILSLFPLFARRVLSFHRAITTAKDEKKNTKGKMAQTRHNAVTPVRLETRQKVGPDQDPNCLPLLVGVQCSDMGFRMICI